MSISQYFENLGFEILPPKPKYSPFYSRENNYFCYSPTDLYYDKDLPNKKYITFQPCSRVEDFCSLNKYHLSSFTILVIYDEINGMRTYLSFLRDFCGADFNRIGIVSIGKSENYTGIEIYIPILLEYGVLPQNILIRSVDEAKYTRRGDGLWSSPGIPYRYFFSIGLFYKINEKDDDVIQDFNDIEKWIEIGEMVQNSNNSNSLGVGYGLERINYIFFNKSYPTEKKKCLGHCEKQNNLSDLLKDIISLCFLNLSHDKKRIN
jgi:hypothetical protein